MHIEILLFGILRDIIGENKLRKKIDVGTTLIDLKKELARSYPKLVQYQNYSIAVNENYAEDAALLKENDVVALIPPVSGG